MTQVAVNAAKGSSQTVLGQIAEEDPGLLTGIVAFQSFACVLGRIEIFHALQCAGQRQAVSRLSHGWVSLKRPTRNIKKTVADDLLPVEQRSVNTMYDGLACANHGKGGVWLAEHFKKTNLNGHADEGSGRMQCLAVQCCCKDRFLMIESRLWSQPAGCISSLVVHALEASRYCHVFTPEAVERRWRPVALVLRRQRFRENVGFIRKMRLTHLTLES